MAKINSKIDKALRKEVIENGVFLGTVLIFGFNDNIYLYENEVYVEQFKLTDDDYIITDFYQGNWEVINTNINSGKFEANEPYGEALIDYMSLYNRSLYLSNKKYREVAKEQFAELKKEYEESGLLDDINTLLKKSKSKTFRYSKYESKKNVGKSLKESSNVKDSELREWIDLATKEFKSMIKNRQKLILKGCKEGYEYGKELLDDYIHNTQGLDDLISQIRNYVKKYTIDYNFYYYLSAYGAFSSNWNLWDKLTDELYESKKSARKSMKESMNLDYSDFDYKKFENWIIRYLEDYECEVNTVEIICDDYGYDVEINIENAENLPSRISDKDYGAFIFDAMYTTNCLYLKMPIVRAMKIAEEFSPKVLKVNDDSILIGDKNSDTEIWLDVWTDNDGDENYTEWDYNQQSFNLNNYEDMVQKYLQQIDDFFYILDGEVSDNF